MRGRDFNTGLRGGLFDARHYERMGSAVWLYGWLVLRQTHQHGTVGWVLGGSAISYREIEEETGFNCRTLERWMQALRAGGYIETEAAPTGVIIRILKAKKFPQGARRFAEGLRKLAGSAPQKWQRKAAYSQRNQEVAAGIGSSSVGRSQERAASCSVGQEFHRRPERCENAADRSTPTPSFLEETENRAGGRACSESDAENRKFDARLLRQLLRAEREEAVRRELAVGTGPEVRRS